MKFLNTFNERLNESKREKIFLNGYEFWLDREKQVLYDKEESKNGIHYDSDNEY